MSSYVPLYIGTDGASAELTREPPDRRRRSSGK